MSLTPDPGSAATALVADASQHKHEAQWFDSDYEDKPKAAWIYVHLVLHCGCALYAPKGEPAADDWAHFGQFVSELRDQYGWNIAAGRGWSSHTSIDPTTGRRDTVHSVRVQRKSLTETHRMQS